MALTLTISGVPYSFPEQGANPPWGEDISTWAQAITNQLTGTVSANDLLLTTFSPANNQASVANVVGFSFDSASVRAFNAFYSIYRVIKTGGGTIVEEYAESGILFGQFLNSTSAWELVQSGINVGDAGITFSMTSGGQLQYTSTNLTLGVNVYSCKLAFRAITTSQESTI